MINNIKFNEEIFVNLKLISTQKTKEARAIKKEEVIILNELLNSKIEADSYIFLKFFPKFLTILKLIDKNKNISKVLEINDMPYITTRNYIFLKVDNAYFVFLKQSTKIKKILFYGYHFISYIKNIVNPQRYFIPKFYISKFQNLFFNIFPRSKFDKIFGIRLLSKEEFLSLYIEKPNSFNTRWRKQHLEPVTDNLQIFKLKDIAKHLGYSTQKNLLILETDTSNKLLEPISHNHKFWQSGNNLLIYSYIYGFRKNVIPYNKINKFLEKNKTVNIFSKDYYESLEKMSSQDVKELLLKKPLNVNGNALTSGRHRALAMIKWIEDENEYIPFYAIHKS